MKISETTINCCKPNGFTRFTGNENSESPRRKVRAKHYHQMSDEVLQLRSVLKAHKDVQESGKMRLFKAIPAITTGLLGITIGLAQPGKLSARAKAGLGFLALTDGIFLGAKAISYLADKRLNTKEEKSPTRKAVETIATIASTVGVGVLATKGLKSTKTFKNLKKVVQKDSKQLAEEINNSRLGKFFNEKITVFERKHKKGVNLARATAPIGLIIGSTVAQLGLADSLSSDIKEKALENYNKGKQIQKIAKEHFDSIDAPEI